MTYCPKCKEEEAFWDDWPFDWCPWCANKAIRDARADETDVSVGQIGTLVNE